MAEDWGLMPSFVEVILKHHEPAEAEHDPYLVEIVALVEYLPAGEGRCDKEGQPNRTDQRGTATSFVCASDGEMQPLNFRIRVVGSVRKLNCEYERLLPLLDENVAGMMGSTS